MKEKTSDHTSENKNTDLNVAIRPGFNIGLAKGLPPDPGDAPEKIPAVNSVADPDSDSEDMPLCEEPDVMDRLLGHKIHQINTGMSRFFCQKNPKEGFLPKTQSTVIGYLIDHVEKGPVYQKDLERDFSISGATVSTLLKSLEKGGLVKRIPSASDARLKEIHLTPLAYEREATIRNTIEELEGLFVRGFSEQETTELHRLLQKVIDNLG